MLHGWPSGAEMLSVACAGGDCASVRSVKVVGDAEICGGLTAGPANETAMSCVQPASKPQRHRIGRAGRCDSPTDVALERAVGSQLRGAEDGGNLIA